ncbi:RodZ family helix-turn-helix domain-containing protein [Massilia endophytica]|uniref:hypothetical protein n=1 Tax=Massilia endophytica TaxID=2899220 RepID=UPI001E6224F8|nr:hypothetical protein [Massilia endophytica]UGQ48666.1 hypothetical protein LSQ66_09460 [Massilia endophytica]
MKLHASILMCALAAGAASAQTRLDTSRNGQVNTGASVSVMGSQPEQAIPLDRQRKPVTIVPPGSTTPATAVPPLSSVPGTVIPPVPAATPPLDSGAVGTPGVTTPLGTSSVGNATTAGSSGTAGATAGSSGQQDSVRR